MTESKNNEKFRRLILYGAGSLILGVLVYLGFVLPRGVLPDAGTLLGMARLHLGMAQVIPETDRAGQPLPFRREHLDKAQEALDKAEKVSPGLAITREFRAFKAWIEGDFSASARWYRDVLEVARQDEAMVVKTRLNLAKVELEGGQLDVALEELQNIDPRERDADWHLTRAKIWHAKGNQAKRQQELVAALEVPGTQDSLMRQIADASFAWGDATALSCYERLEAKTAIDWYRMARLKIAEGETDRARNALDRVHATDPELLARLLTQDSGFWDAYRETGILERDADRNGRPAAAPGK